MKKDRLACLVTALSFGLAGPVLSQTPDTLVSITVAGDSYFSKAHTIVIEADTYRVPRNLSDVKTRRWRAIRTSENGTDRITSDECPALRERALDFDAMTSGSLRSPVLTPRPAVQPIPPTIKDGFWTTLNYQALLDDGSIASVELSGGAFARWGNQAISSFLPCWGPLIPPPPEGLTASRLLQGLDLSSVPNSTESSSTNRFNRPENWGFTQFRADGEAATLERPDGRAISLKIIRWSPDGYLVCFYARHSDGESYDTYTTLRLVNDGLAGFKVAEQEFLHPACLAPPTG